jgi:hypothetical protein
MPTGTLPRHSRRLDAVRFPVASFCLHQARRPRHWSDAPHLNLAWSAASARLLPSLKLRPLPAMLTVGAGFLPHLVPCWGSQLPGYRHRGPGLLSLPAEWLQKAPIAIVTAATRWLGTPPCPAPAGYWASRPYRNQVRREGPGGVSSGPDLPYHRPLREAGACLLRPLKMSETRRQRRTQQRLRNIDVGH